MENETGQVQIQQPSEPLASTLAEMQKLSTWADGWNGYDALAPKAEAIQNATQWIQLLYQEVIDLSLDWVEPAVTADAEGNPVFEWWNGSKTLTIYVENQSVAYLKSWGPDMDAEMVDGKADSADERKSLWKWLIS